MHSPPPYTIPLDKRLAAHGRGLHEVQMNEKLFEALYVAEQKASEAVATTSKLLKEKERKLRAFAQKARSVRVGTGGSYVTSETNMMDTDEPMRIQSVQEHDQDQPRESTAEREEHRMERERIREERRRERELSKREKVEGQRSRHGEQEYEGSGRSRIGFKGAGNLNGSV